MTRRPFQPDETGSAPGGVDPVARDLERYAELTAGEVPHGLVERVMASVADQPTPRRGVLATLLAPLTLGAGGGMVRMTMVAATVALAVIAVVLAGQLGDLFRNPEIGPSPEPSLVQTPSASPTRSASPSPSPSPTMSPTVSPTPMSTEPAATPSGADDEVETPEPSDDDEVETPEPSDEDSSGPGGGDGSD